MRSGHVFGVNDVFYPDCHAVQRTPFVSGHSVESASRRENGVGVKVRPCLDEGITLLDMLNQGCYAER